MREKLMYSKVALAVAAPTAAVLLALLLLNGTVTGVIQGQLTLPNVGTVRAIAVGVYWDAGCSDQVTSIDWGSIDPGATVSEVVYIRNEGNAPMTLSSKTENWSPSTASTYMSLGWDYAGQAIDVDEVVRVTLSLSVSDAIEGITSFSFDIVIIGSD